MDNNLFRKKSIDKISSPEQLNDYIRVSNPGVWIVLIASLFLLTGFLVFAVFGRINTIIPLAAVSEQGSVYCYIKEDDLDKIALGTTVEIEGQGYPITELSSTPTALSDEADDYLLYSGEIMPGEWVYTAVLDATLDDGIYEASVTTESIALITFIIN